MTLAEQAQSLSQDEIITLLATNQVLVKSNDDYQSKNEVLERRIAWLERQLFGPKSERRLVCSADNQLTLGAFTVDEEELPLPQETVKQYQRRRGSKLILEDAVNEAGLQFGPDVPIEVIELPTPEIQDLDASEYAIVSEKVTHRLAQRPGSYVILKYVRKVVKLKRGKLVCTKAPDAVLEKSYADVSFLAGLLIDKFCWHLPLYRQHQRLLDSGIQLSRSTLTNLVHRSVHLLEPVYLALLSSILQSRVLMMDETPLKATRLKGKMKTGYFWPVYGDQDEIAFVFSNSRAGPVVQEVLGSFCGTLVTDGYPVYAKHAATLGYTHAQCWAHARRQFVDAEAAEPKLCGQALDFIGQLYRLEQEVPVRYAYLPDRLQYLRKRVAPIVQQFFTWLQKTLSQQALLPTNPFTKAAHYALQREKELSLFLKDPAVPMDTNAIEQEIRPVALGRKNWLFCWSEVGARYAGMIYSLIRTCKLHGINPYDYLVDILQRANQHDAFEVHLLTPKNWKNHFAQNPLRSDLSITP